MNPQQQALDFNIAYIQFCQKNGLNSNDQNSYNIFKQYLNDNILNNPQPLNIINNNNNNKNNIFNSNNNLNFNNNFNNNFNGNNGFNNNINLNFNKNINNNSNSFNNNFNLNNFNNFNNNFSNVPNNFINNPNNFNLNNFNNFNYNPNNNFSINPNNFSNNPNNFSNNPNNNFSNNPNNIFSNNPNNNFSNNPNNNFSNNPNNFSHSHNNIGDMNLINNSLININQKINNNNFEEEIFNNNGTIYMSTSVKEVMPRKEETLYVNKELQNKPDTINVTFSSSTGFNIMITASKFTSFEELFKIYMKRLNLPDTHIGKDILFSFNGKIVDHKSKVAIWNYLKMNNSRIEVLDIGNVLGA